MDSITSTDVDVSVTNPSFSMPEKAVTVNVTFKEKPSHNITKGTMTNGDVDVPTTAREGDKVTITAKPASGFAVEDRKSVV